MTKPLADAAREMAEASKRAVPSENATDDEVARFERARHELQQAVAAHDAAREGYRERARRIAHDIDCQVDIDHGAAGAWCRDFAEELIARELATAAAEARAAQRREDLAKVDDLKKTFAYESHPDHVGKLYNDGFKRACDSIAAAIEAGGQQLNDQQRGGGGSREHQIPTQSSFRETERRSRSPQSAAAPFVAGA